MKIQSRCYKFLLPNAKVVDVLVDLMDDITQYLQSNHMSSESGGYILGYQHRETGNIVLESITTPQKDDFSNRIRFTIKDASHKKLLRLAHHKQSYYMGVWHTHPQGYPVPSSIDWHDWQQSVQSEKTGGDYVFYFIAGTEEFRIWVGDPIKHGIVEIYEVSKEGKLYIKNDFK